MFNLLIGMPKMRKLLMTRKRQDGSTSMVMCSGSPNTNLCLLQPLVLAASCLLCKDVTLLFVRISFSLLWCHFMPTIDFWLNCIHFQHCIYFYACASGCILSIQPRSSIYSTGGHICTHFWDCGIYSCLFLLSARRNKLGMLELTMSWAIITSRHDLSKNWMLWNNLSSNCWFDRWGICCWLDAFSVVLCFWHSASWTPLPLLTMRQQHCHLAQLWW